MSSATLSGLPYPDENSLTRARTESGLPWYVWCAAAAVTSAVVGAHWDISWHISIGRDSFLTPAHIAIYMCGVLAGIAFGFLVLTTTFVKNAPLAASSVHILGLRAPLGAFIASWGGVAMLTSAPFDDWWHSAYGLDVAILSPPHIVLFIGVYAVLVGTLVLIAGTINRTSGRAKESARLLYLYIAGIMLVAAMVLIMELIGRSWQHSSGPYLYASVLALLLLGSTSRATGFRFSGTAITGFYTLFLIILIQILPLFPAEPKLGPVFQPVTHFIPPEFPLLLIVPAFALDLLWHKNTWNVWLLSLVSALLFVSLLLAVQYPFSTFLMSPASRNAFFGTNYLGYGVPPASFVARHLFYNFETPAQFWSGIAMAFAFGALAVRYGFSRGEWLAKVQR